MSRYNCVVLVVVALWVHSVDAASLRATAQDRRSIQASVSNPAPESSSMIPMCALVGRDKFATVMVAPADAWRYTTFYQAARGACQAVCGTQVCGNHVTFSVTALPNQASTCTCLGTPIVCGKHAQLGEDRKTCECKTGYQGDAKTGCVDRNECAESVATACPSNHQCLNVPLGSFTCVVRTCSDNQFNPCGPGRACSDTPTGFVCGPTPGNGDACPAGCGPNSSCRDNDCVCNEGFARPQPFLPCLAVPVGTNTTATPTLSPIAPTVTDPASAPVSAPTVSLSTAAPVAAAPVAPAPVPTSPQRLPPCGDNASRASSAANCTCNTGYQGDASPGGVGCTDRDECLDMPKVCPSNQDCSNTDGSYICLAIKCAQPSGNPCGPGRACTDTVRGYTCTDLFPPDICPAGCSPNSTCQRPAVGSSDKATCVCDAGFVRPNPFLGCVPEGDVNGTIAAAPVAAPAVAPAAAPTVADPTVSPPCGPNAERLSNGAAACTCKAGYQGADPVTAGCTDVNECALNSSLPRPCQSNQECINTDGSFTCAPLECANPFGNPCGPGRACADSPTGYTCTDLFGPNVCPAGCEPNSTCTRVPGSERASCVCDAGFIRPNPSLGCVPQA